MKTQLNTAWCEHCKILRAVGEPYEAKITTNVHGKIAEIPVANCNTCHNQILLTKTQYEHMKKPENETCKSCGRKMETNSLRKQQYCSIVCRRRAYDKRRKKKIMQNG